MTESSEQPVCANCGDTMSKRGTPSPVDGRRFCTRKRACINAKNRLRRLQRVATPADDTEGPHCANCGAKLSGRGTASPADGKRFCSDRRSCINAKNALRRAERMGPLDLETRPCSWCKAELTHRPKRKTDSPLGRWCDKPVCKNQGRDALDMHERLVDEFAAAEIAECSECGQGQARVGWVHPRPGTARACFGPASMWQRGIDIVILMEAWPADFAAAVARQREQAATLDSTGP